MTALHLALAEIHEILIPSGAQADPRRSTPAKAGGWPRPSARSPPTVSGCSAASPPSNRASTTSPARSPGSRRPRRARSLPPRARSSAKPGAGRRHLEHQSSEQCMPMPPQPPAPIPSKPEFGLDLGSASRSRRCAPPGPPRFAATGRCSKGCGRWCRCASGPPRCSRTAPDRRPHPECRDGGPALRDDDGSGRGLRARDVRRPAARRPLDPSA